MTDLRVDSFIVPFTWKIYKIYQERGNGCDWLVPSRFFSFNSANLSRPSGHIINRGDDWGWRRVSMEWWRAQVVPTQSLSWVVRWPARAQWGNRGDWVKSSLGLVVGTGFNLITVLIFFLHTGSQTSFFGRRKGGGGKLGKFTGINSRAPYVKRLIPLI